MRLSVTPRELTWVHPDRGEGGIRWAEVGAFVLRETAKGDDITICLVPRAGEAEDGFMLSANDFGLGVEEGEARLSGFVSEITPFLPADIVVDRAMRKKMAEWGLRT